MLGPRAAPRARLAGRRAASSLPLPPDADPAPCPPHAPGAAARPGDQASTVHSIATGVQGVQALARAAQHAHCRL